MNNTSTQEIIRFIKVGCIGVMPTDTLMGLVCSALDKAAVERLYALKERHGKPGTIIAADKDQLVALGLKRRYVSVADEFWGHPVSVVIPCGNESLAYLHQGKQSLAARIPGDQTIVKILKETGPLLTSSANLSGQTPAQNIAEAKAYFKDIVDFYMAPHDAMLHKPSTIVQVVDDNVVVLRQGAATIDEKTGVIEQ